MPTQHDRKTIHAFPFAEKDPRNPGKVEVVERTSTFENGNVRKFIDVNIKIGERFMGVQARHIDELIAALKAAKPKAEEEEAKLPPPPPFEQRRGGSDDRRDRGRGRHGGDRRYRYNEE